MDVTNSSVVLTWCKRGVALFSVLIYLHLYIRDTDLNVTQIYIHTRTPDAVVDIGFQQSKVLGRASDCNWVV